MMRLAGACGGVETHVCSWTDLVLVGPSVGGHSSNKGERSLMVSSAF